MLAVSVATGRLASGVVVSAQKVHGLAQLVQENEGTDANQTAEDIPAPEGTGAKAVSDAAAAQLVADTGADAVAPHDGGDTAGDGCHQEEQQAVVHGLLAVITGGDDVDIGGNVGVEYNAVDAKGDDAQQDRFNHTAVGFHNGYLFLFIFRETSAAEGLQRQTEGTVSTGIVA